jgi:hypothetical protein
MAKNLGREYATMSEEERRKFALEEEAGNRELPAELEFDDPRREENMGQHYATAQEEVADPEHRDGMSAQLDDQAHQQAVRDAATRGECVDDTQGTKSRIDDV